MSREVQVRFCESVRVQFPCATRPRSVKDLCLLVDEYFAKERYDLISVCGMVNTHTAAGRLMMLNLANYAQYERELISERTREAMQHMKAQGVRLGVAPYGYKHGHKLDDKGRRVLEPVESEQAVIKQMAQLHAGGTLLKRIAAILNEQGTSARRGGPWRARLIGIILEREGQHARQRFRRALTPSLVTDRERSAERARVLRGEGHSLREIGRRLRGEGLVPARGGEWHAASVAELLTHHTQPDPKLSIQRASALRKDGKSLREIAVQLQREGHLPIKGGRWYAATVSALLASER